MYYLENLNDIDIENAKKEHYKWLQKEIEKKFKKKYPRFNKLICKKKLDNLLKLLLIGTPDKLDNFYSQHKHALEINYKKELIKHLFSYRAFSTKRKSYSAYDLAKNLNIPTCVYCNRIYTKTVIDKKNKKPYTRPTFDHWFAQSKYPIFALSFYNLIPCCNICNNIKSNKEMTLSENFHPYYNDGQNLDIKFSFKHKTLNTTEVRILHSNSLLTINYLETFNLEPIYKAHLDEVNDLIEITKLYTPAYLKSLRTILHSKKKIINDESLYKLAFGTYTQEEDYHKRPLSKLKKDLLSKLEIIK